uniref:Zinc knuckle CX2CX4HX4C domain-containing protein n=1 Tax=Nelumbo nucifera TaxID=4432 RepID=A0A822XXF8_NELNU|nr:TPA_asm: hypothetical protein HUJ06_027772 [Nelumbo nucifera]
MAEETNNIEIIDGKQSSPGTSQQVTDLGLELEKYVTLVSPHLEINVEPVREASEVVKKTLRGRISPCIKVTMENVHAFIKHAWNPTHHVNVGHDDSGGWVFIFKEEELQKVFASAAGRVLEDNPEIEPGKPMRGSMVRFHIEIDLRKPLSRGFFLKNNNNPIWVRFAYENLTKLCIYCGLVGHKWKKCKLIPKSIPLNEIMSELEERKLDELGEWLRAEHRPEKPFNFPIQ